MSRHNRAHRTPAQKNRAPFIHFAYHTAYNRNSQSCPHCVPVAKIVSAIVATAAELREQAWWKKEVINVAETVTK